MSTTISTLSSSERQDNISNIAYGLDDPEGINRIPALVWTSLLLVIGTVGNLHALIIYIRLYKRQMGMTIITKKENPYVVFVLSLTTLDLLTCAFILTVDIIDTCRQFTLLPEEMCRTFRYFQTVLQISSVAHMTIISIHCLRKIRFQHKRQIQRVFAFSLCLGSDVFAFLLGIPAAFMSGYHTQIINGESGPVCFVTDSNIGTIEAKIYMILLASLFGVCVIMVCTSNILLASFRLQHHQKKIVNREIKSIDERPRKTTAILIIITVSFVMSYLPFFIFAFMGVADEHFRETWNIASFATYRVFARFPYLNNIINPFIYCCKDRDYRKILGDMYNPLIQKCKSSTNQ